MTGGKAKWADSRGIIPCFRLFHRGFEAGKRAWSSGESPDSRLGFMQNFDFAPKKPTAEASQLYTSARET